MSMHSWSEDGFGYPVYGDNFYKLKDFLLENITDEKILKEIKDTESNLDIESVLLSHDTSASEIIADAINKKENVNVFSFYAQETDGGEPEAVGIAPVYPWTITTEEMKTRDEYIAILNKYAEILGITECPDYFEREYYG